MILTVTPNPTVDRDLFVRHFRLEGVLRAEREVVVPCGKGVSSALVIHELGGRTVALGLTAGHTGAYHRALLDGLGVRHEFVEADGETRTVIVLVDLAAQQQVSISAQTLRASAAHLEQLLALQARHARGAWGVLYGGTLPAGLPPDAYAHLIAEAHRLGLVTLLDASGEALARGAGAQPDILKVNRDELAALEPETAPAGDSALLAARLRECLGVWARQAIVVTLGDLGALCVTAEVALLVRPPQVPVVNTAGAGDALGGGLMLARSRGADWADALRLGTAAAASVVMNEGTAICQRQQVEALMEGVRVDVVAA